jgi:hypothetical protein
VSDYSSLLLLHLPNLLAGAAAGVRIVFNLRNDQLLSGGWNERIFLFFFLPLLDVTLTDFIFICKEKEKWRK